jgi:glycosyl transferase family 87
MTRFAALLTPARRRAALTGLALVGLVALPYLWVRNWERSFWGFDAFAYWSIDLSNLYGRSYGNTSGLGAFRYTPPVGQAFSVLDVLPWEVFFGLYFLAMVGVLYWASGRRPLVTLALVALPPVALELYHGNVHLFMAAAIVVGFRFPAAWAFVILAKVTPGIGALWFVFRREWRSAITIALATGGIALASYLVAPHLWTEYLSAMRDNISFRPIDGYPFDVPQVIRIPLAILLVWWGARTDRRWTVPVAATIALPLIWWHGLSMLVAILPILREDRARAASEAPAAGTGRPLPGTLAVSPRG